MSTSGKGRKPLVAERRKPKTTAKPKARRKPARRKSAPRKGNFVTRLIGGLLRWIMRVIWAITWRVGLVTALLLGSGIAYFAMQLPEPADLVDGRARGSVTLRDRHGQTFAWRGDQFGGMITAASVSPHLKNAIVATEDKRFFWHPGIDPRGIASAVRINLREGRGPLSGHGGSTLTQQTAKLLCLGTPYRPEDWKSETAYEADCRRGTLWRKIKEAVYAMAMEVRYTKDEILTIYLNRAFLGSGARGFEAASKRYFGKTAADLRPAEAAMLAGLLVAPTRYAPTNSLKRSQERAATVIELMKDQGYLSTAQASQARANPATLSRAAAARAGGYFADWVMSTGPEFFTRSTTEDVIIRTTLDPKIQRAAEEAMEYIFDTKVRQGSKAQAAIVVMSADGAVRGMVGGRQTRVSGAFNRATQAKRQTGSAFKPFVYAAALDLGMRFNDWVEDSPLTIQIPGSGPYTPNNYSKKFLGPVTLTTALAKSLNIPAVRISERIGRDIVRKVASDFGIASDLAAGPALALGASEASLLEMTGAYAGILNGGSAVTPYGLVELRLQGETNPVMGSGGGIRERVISTQAARQLTYMMSKVITEGTGRRGALSNREVAGKTGTSQSARDAWFIGFTADYVTGVWMGYDDNTPLTGVTGSGLPAEIWQQTMKRVHADTPANPLPMIRPSASQALPPPRRGTDKPRQAPRENDQNVSERVLLQVLQDLFGGN